MEVDVDILNLWMQYGSVCFSSYDVGLLNKCFTSVLILLAICNRLYRDVQLILVAVRGLPSDNVGSSGDQKPGELDELLVQRFGAEPPP